MNIRELKIEIDNLCHYFQSRMIDPEIFFEKAEDLKKEYEKLKENL